MKICPQCAFVNEEEFPTCVWCSRSLARVASSPSADPANPEHQRRAVQARRSAAMRSQNGWALVFYVGVITGSVAGLGMGWDMRSFPALLLFFAGSLVVGLGILRGWAGQFSGCFLQGGISAAIFIYFQLFHPLVFFVMGIHICLSMLFWHWTGLISDANR